MKDSSQLIRAIRTMITVGNSDDITTGPLSGSLQTVLSYLLFPSIDLLTLTKFITNGNQQQRFFGVLQSG